MAKLSQFHKRKSFIYLCSHFGTEFLLFLILASAVATNLLLRTNSTRAQTLNRSLFFVYLKNHPERNRHLVDAYESIKQTPDKINLASLPLGQKEVLAAPPATNSASVSSGPLPTLAGSALLKPNPSTSSNVLPKRDIEVYEVRGGDTVARIAAAYGVSPETILSENDLGSSALIRPGQELKILPTTGVTHIIAKGETLGEIAVKYGVDLETILEYNDIEIPEHILPGEEIIIPNGVKSIPPTQQRQDYLASLNKNDYEKIEVPADYQGGGSDLIWPMPAARRLSQRFWSRHRGIDIPCRDCAMNAAASGIVELAGWQTGYGITIVINHGNGLKTRYAHGSKLLVAAGQAVNQGEQIMVSGSTGRSSGPHLHFEIIKNGVLIDPLTLVR